MAAALLKIASLPSDSMTESNCVYISTEERPDVLEARFIKVRDFIFSVRTDPMVKPGQLGMNGIQRKCVGVTATAMDTEDVPPGGFVPKGMGRVGVLKIEVEYVAASKRGGTLDATQFSDYFKNQFKGQYFKSGQSLAVILDSMQKYIARIQSIGDLNTEATTQPEFSQLLDDSTIIITTKEKCEITMINVPDEQLDEQQQNVVNAFNLEDLGIGGLQTEFGNVFRRAFTSRIFPQSIVKKLGIKHAKGVLLYGPPGTGKTLIARKIGEILNCHTPKVVNGPEVFNKFVGGTEENIRALFKEAEAEQASKGDQSKLHLIIFDEFDAICKQRGAVRDSTGVSDNVVNQLLSKIDGVNSLNNVLLIGMTNRKDLIDEAILRPGRFEVHVEIGLADEKGREQIFRIHTRNMRENDVIAADVNLAELAARAKNFSGAEIEGVVRSATTHAFKRHIDFDNPSQTVDPASIKIGMADFVSALDDVTPAFGCATDECEAAMRNGVIDYGPAWRHIQRECENFAKHLGEGSAIQSLSVLLEGEIGSGKSAVAANLGILSQFPYVKLLSCDNMVGYGEPQKSNLIRKAFEDAYKSKQSVIILDDIERLIEYSRVGARYSNMLLQTLLVLIKRQPPEGHKLLVVGTTSLPEVLEELELAANFSLQLHLPKVEGASLPNIVRGIGAKFGSQGDEEQCMAAVPHSVPIKRLIMVVEMATEVEADGTKVLKYPAFANALASAGI